MIDNKNTDKDIICPNCECTDLILDHGEAEDLRPNKQNMHVFECETCTECWKE